MATQLLGDQLDIHCGGVDNIFPHHEAEIAQTEGCTGKKFVRYWLHCAHLMVEGQKMAKSLGNFYTLRDVIAKGYTGREVRYALMRVHYRAPLNFTWEGMEEAREALRRIDDWVRRLNAETESKDGPETPSSKLQAPEKLQAQNAERSEFHDALDDDLNISGALGVLFETIRETNRRIDGGEIDASEAKSWLEWWKRVDQVLAISGEDEALPAEVAALAEARVQARLAKEWRKSDELRDELAARGWEARDTKDGQKITRRGGA
jgi:cysteinyl-tRNA synthetase